MTDKPPTPAGSFACPKCHDTYAPHWHATDGSALCRMCEDERDDHCQIPNHPNHPEYPCSFGPSERPGEPCSYCGEPTPDDPPCRNCWGRFDEMPFADIRATFAELGLDTTVTRSEP